MDSGDDFRKPRNAMKSIFSKVVIAAAMSFVHASAKEILIHSGPTVSTPDLELYTPHPSPGRPEKELKFIYEFPVDSEILEKIPGDHYNPVPLSATKAIELASKSAEVEKRKDPFPVRRLELLTFDLGPKQIRYYLVTLMTDNSAETHRVVLMDGTVVKPKLRKADP